MSSVYKRAEDRNRKGSKWIVRYFDHDQDRWRSKTGYTDKDLSVALGQRLEQESGLRREGFTDSVRERSLRPIEEPLAEFLMHIRSGEVSEDYLGQLERRIRKIIEATGAKRLIDFDAGKVEDALLCLRCQRGFQEEPGKLASVRTRNEYATSIKQFTLWAHGRRWIAHDPLAGVAKPRLSKIGKERPRRALSAAEVGQLLDATLRRPEIELLTIRTGKNKGKLGAKIRAEVLERAEKLGQDRWMAYLLVVWTGLRRGELTKLQWRDVFLDVQVPHLLLRAEATKAGRSEAIPLHEQLVAALRGYRPSEAKPTTPVLIEVPSPRVIMKDLAFAGIEYGNQEIGYADLHAQRKTLNHLLAEHGVSPRTRQAQLRHSDPRLTELTYWDTSIYLLPQSKEIAKVPAIPMTARQSGVEASVSSAEARGGATAAELTRTGAEEGAALMQQTIGSAGHVEVQTGNSRGNRAAQHGGGATSEKACFPARNGTKRQGPAPVGTGPFEERVKGVEPSTFTLATRPNDTPKSSKMPVFMGFYHVPGCFSSLFRLSRFLACYRSISAWRSVNTDHQNQ
jgi:integrase